jgi:hypothetical protein
MSTSAALALAGGDCQLFETQQHLQKLRRTA